MSKIIISMWAAGLLVPLLLVAAAAAAAAGGAAAADDVAAAAWRTLEDVVEPELFSSELGRLRRFRLSLGNIAPAAFDRNRPYCNPKCAAKGQPYFGRGCEGIYGC
ncbi:hypothetical protein ACP70R_011677 [Stipagrostis hirtigluma subsp. patula]